MKAFGAAALLAAVVLVSGSACSERDLLPLEGRVFLSVGEFHRNPGEPGPPAILIRLETEKIYGACNYVLVAQARRVGGDVLVDVEGVREPEVFLWALGPAGFGEFLDLEDGRYALEIHSGRARSAFWLTVDATSLIVQWQSDPGSGLAAPKYSCFWRYPENSFAVLCGTMVENAWIYEDFLSRLRAAVELREIEFPAHGELGYPRAPQGHWVNHPGRYFVYEGPEDFEAAGEVLRAFVRDFSGQLQGVGIELRNWRNESFMSWLMD